MKFSSQNINHHIAGTSVPTDFLRTGKYEFTSLVTLGIEKLATTLDPQLDDSYLTVIDPNLYFKMGKPRLSFDFNCVTDRSKLNKPKRSLGIVEMCDYTWPDGKNERIYKTQILMKIAERLIHTDIWLTQRSIRSTNFVLGAETLHNKILVSLNQAFEHGE
jgi:hypothetical protein